MVGLACPCYRCWLNLPPHALFLSGQFGVGMMDFEVIEYAKKNDIHIVSFSSTSEASTDLANMRPTVAKIAAEKNISTFQVLYAYVHSRNLTVLSTFDPDHLDWAQEDIGIL